MKLSTFLLSILVGLSSLAPIASAQAQREATIQSDTKAQLTLRSQINSKLNEAGDIITATLAEPIYVDGQMVAQRGTEFRGHITKIARAKRGQRSSHLQIEFDHIVTPSGEVPISAQLVAIDDWDQEVSIKANSKGDLKGGHRGERTIDNVQRGGTIGLSGGIVGAGLGGAAGASGRFLLGMGAAGVAAGMIGGLLLTKGSDLRAGPGAMLRIKFNRPVTLPVDPSLSNSTSVSSNTRKESW